MAGQYMTRRRRPGVFRRLGAALYDSLLLLAVWFFATLIALIPRGGIAFSSDDYLYVGYLIGVAFVYLGSAWTRQGQTLGMRAWNICYYTDESLGMNWLRAGRRFFGEVLCLGSLGLGYAWCWVDADGRSWSDRISSTRLDWERSKPEA